MAKSDGVLRDGICIRTTPMEFCRWYTVRERREPPGTMLVAPRSGRQASGLLLRCGAGRLRVWEEAVDAVRDLLRPIYGTT